MVESGLTPAKAVIPSYIGALAWGMPFFANLRLRCMQMLMSEKLIVRILACLTIDEYSVPIVSLLPRNLKSHGRHPPRSLTRQAKSPKLTFWSLISSLCGTKRPDESGVAEDEH